MQGLGLRRASGQGLGPRPWDASFHIGDGTSGGVANGGTSGGGANEGGTTGDGTSAMIAPGEVVRRKLPSLAYTMTEGIGEGEPITSTATHHHPSPCPGSGPSPSPDPALHPATPHHTNDLSFSHTPHTSLSSLSRSGVSTTDQTRQSNPSPCPQSDPWIDFIQSNITSPPGDPPFVVLTI